MIILAVLTTMYAFALKLIQNNNNTNNFYTVQIYERKTSSLK